MEKSHILDENLGLKHFLLLFKRDVLLSRKTFLYGEYRQLHFPGLFGIKYKKKMKKIQFFDQNHGLTPLEKCKFSTF